jgi:Domain of unknown function (DU1801)
MPCSAVPLWMRVGRRSRLTTVPRVASQVYLGGMARVPAMRPTGESPDSLLAAIPDHRRRADAEELRRLLQEVTGEMPQVWASRILGFGTYRYRYESGHEGEAPVIGFAIQTIQFVIYLIGDYKSRHATEVSKLGKFKTGKGCLYIRRLADVDVAVLRQLLERSVRVHRGVNRANGGS